jgi:bifunctional DNA-binding transcriptional regulator/antitoxin component of YhaV-PrlF toxin-antitoxin module
MKSISIIRGRGQLTIPDSIRKAVNWINPLSAVSVTVVKPDEIVIRPHQSYIDWKKIESNMKKLQAYSGKSKLSAAEILEHDRQSH